MKTLSRFGGATALFVWSAAVLAAPVWAVPDSPAKPILDGMIGKHQILGFTENGGTRFLGRVLSGDHGLYVVQTFHYVTTPNTSPVTTTQTSYVLGRRGQVRPVTKRVTQRVTTQNTIPDATAVKALVSGVAGATFRPQEQPAGRELIAPTDLRYLQQLSPPPTGKTNWTLQTLWTAPATPAVK